ncbi:MAG: ATPase [Prevotella sp.]|uniref:ATPase n=1 Tax=Prevotella sp. TaxID=59823 RepID=UPI002A951AA4|nr:ATPase [Prevotella sp.]MDD7190089.1 ATPase [Prevotella sp.]MDY5314635.1 ATPase [Prevotella sp.]
MILLADSGSTKTDWGLVENGKLVKRLRTSGMNPFQMSEEAITEEIKTHLVPELPGTVLDEVHFYGAGCTKEKQPIVERALRANLTINGECEVASDMLGAARGICGHKPGIACILGTGSNSCSYDGKNLVKNVSPLGFILGDEGSGAVLGKLLVGDVLKNQMPEAITKRFFEKYKLTSAEIIDRVYRQPKPNTFLASFVPFLEENIDEPKIYNLVKESFRSFLRRNVMQYDGWQTLPIGFNGSIAKIYKKPLLEALEEEGMHLGRIIQAPMEAMVEYHVEK